MKLPVLILSAVILDLILGDPRNFPHPVRLIGEAAREFAFFFRARLKSRFWAGAWTALSVGLLAFFIPHAILKLAYRVSPWAGDALSVYFIYTTLAIRDLIEHSKAVYRALSASNLEEARLKTGYMVGRDTGSLSEKEVTRACVESVAESMVDGVTAPLFFAVFGGPAWAMLYRSVNTLDSLFGYKDAENEHFGKVSARLDDAANYLPARITSLLVSPAAMMLYMRPLGSLRVLFRDGRKNPSPNSGLPEAAVAGALGVRLGGDNFYQGILSRKPYLGDETQELQPGHILQANRLMLVTSLLTCALYLLLGRIM